MKTPDATPIKLLEQSYAGFRPLAEKLETLDARLQAACGSGSGPIADRARQLRRKIAAFEPSVTMIGQVKAGKTTLVNAMTGWSGLLPADVNPWTSVVTSLHLKPAARRERRNASFTFFTGEEWEHLVQRGGRMGELAGRAGADDELDKVRAQLEKMRAKSRDRLGKRFELLLGQSHDYDRFDESLIERYVCIGDDFWDEATGDRDRGRFADITRSADLWLSQPELPVSLCVRDTPGVNDTFMIREQITINALRGSRLCIMVLSATQALSSVDLALIRMISNVAARDVVIFVNRIDELADPARDVVEIRESIVETLSKLGGPKDVEIIFGCGIWAEHILTGSLEELPQDSAEALLGWAETNYEAENPFDTLEEMVWHLSGMHALGTAIATRIEAGAGARMLQELEVKIGNLDQSLSAASAVSARVDGPGGGCLMDAEALQQALNEVEHAARLRLVSGLAPLQRSLSGRIETSRQTFVDRATAAVIRHMEAHGAVEVWRYDPCGLRVLLRSAFQRYVRAASNLGSESLAAAAADLSALYARAFDLQGTSPAIEPPPLPQPDPPVVLGQSIALDLQGNWWSRFWRRRKGYKACAEDFASLIRQETEPMLKALMSDNAERFEEALLETLSEFLATHRKIMLGMAEPESMDAETHPDTPVPPRHVTNTVQPMEAIR
ncbi:dynamin family protein [Aestuariicoccus sp. MJ-SS9]|uniref:dynamin family protein n=1 Tax=Aestuariicoccus sp. MJ-SS9 TaxID=3079855 RepID=UPI002913374B|nr:dynamin family protein [Aestuariicoccus sp. MJ-SS9]MDU8913553.1 dynamin family protein [Aestuariicoccus sp. MJ-SS9]